MRDDMIFFILLCCLLTGCVSATREREAHCVAATMMDLWQMEDELTSAEQAWRTAQYTRVEQSAAGPDFSALSARVAGWEAPPPVVEEASLRLERLRPASRGEADLLYGRIVAARGRHERAMKWHGLVTRRVQTRIEEDEMLYPVLGMLATSMAIVLYPLVRWNVRSVLWEGIDPDAETDPVQRFCAARLRQENHNP